MPTKAWYVRTRRGYATLEGHSPETDNALAFKEKALALEILGIYPPEEEARLEEIVIDENEHDVETVTLEDLAHRIAAGDYIEEAIQTTTVREADEQRAFLNRVMAVQNDKELDRLIVDHALSTTTRLLYDGARMVVHHSRTDQGGYGLRQQDVNFVRTVVRGAYNELIALASKIREEYKTTDPAAVPLEQKKVTTELMLSRLIQLGADCYVAGILRGRTEYTNSNSEDPTAHAMTEELRKRNDERRKTNPIFADIGPETVLGGNCKVKFGPYYLKADGTLTESQIEGGTFQNYGQVLATINALYERAKKDPDSRKTLDILVSHRPEIVSDTSLN